MEIVFFVGKILHLPSNFTVMKKCIKLISFLLVIVMLFSSCASSQSSRAMRKAERQMEKMEKQSKKNFKQAKSAHYKHQAKKTKRMIKKDKRHAERMRRRQRSNPFFSWGAHTLINILPTVKEEWSFLWVVIEKRALKRKKKLSNKHFSNDWKSKI